MTPTTPTPATPSAADIVARISDYLTVGMNHTTPHGRAKMTEMITDHTAAAVESQRVKDRELHVMQLAAISTATVQNTESSIKDRIGKDNPYCSQAYLDVCVAIDREMRHRDDLTTAQSRIAALEGEKAGLVKDFLKAVADRNEAEIDAEAAERQLAEAQRELARRPTHEQWHDLLGRKDQLHHDLKAATQLAANLRVAVDKAHAMLDTEPTLTPRSVSHGALDTRIEKVIQLAAQRAGEADKLKPKLILTAADLTSLRAQLTQEQEAHKKTRLETDQWHRACDQRFREKEVLHTHLTLSQQRAECADRLADALSGVMKYVDYASTIAEPGLFSIGIGTAREALTAYAALPPATNN